MHDTPDSSTSTAETPAADFADCMLHGSQLHAAGQIEFALIAFENALAIQPASVDAASACATMLSALSRPMAAYRTLLTVEAALLETADGAANLAIAAESCGDMARAQRAYQQALALDPKHLRALNNVGLTAASKADWAVAIACGRQCADLQPGEPAYRVNLSDFLSGARQYAQALEELATAIKQFPDHIGLRARRVVVLAFHGEFEKSMQALASLDAAARAALKDYLHLLLTPAQASPAAHAPADALLDAWQLYTLRAFEAMADCDWQGNARLTQTLRDMLAQAQQTGQSRNWCNAPFYGLMLALDENEVAQLCSAPVATAGADLKPALPALAPFTRRQGAAARHDGRIHIGLAVHSLHDALYARTLERQLALHDSVRFAMHVYSSTPQPVFEQTDRLKAHAASAIDIAHMRSAEAVARIRLDQLDVFVDTTLHTEWHRPDIMAMRVAPVQMHLQSWQRHSVPPADYTLSDSWVHPDGLDLTPYGAVVRLPYTCWLATGVDAPEAGLTRLDAGLPDDRLVLASFVPAVNIDPQSFSVWMKLLRSLPDAVLWLPACHLTAAANLAREANAAGVSSGRLLFAAPMSRAKALASMQHADLFVDSLRFNANQGLADALRLGVPAITCSGASMASRLGGSILRAAGLPQCVFDSQDAYVADALRLGRNPAALQSLREQLKAANPSAPLFDVAARVKEWEVAWTVMSERSRAGLPPAAFDVQPFTATPAHS